MCDQGFFRYWWVKKGQWGCGTASCYVTSPLRFQRADTERESCPLGKPKPTVSLWVSLRRLCQLALSVRLCSRQQMLCFFPEIVGGRERSSREKLSSAFFLSPLLLKQARASFFLDIQPVKAILESGASVQRMSLKQCTDCSPGQNAFSHAVNPTVPPALLSGTDTLHTGTHTCTHTVTGCVCL